MNTHVRDNLNHLAEQINRTGWTSWTPTWTNLTIGNATQAAKYAYAGMTTFFRIEITLGNTSSVGTTPTFTLPQTAVSHQSYFPIARAAYNDSGTAVYDGLVIFASTTAAYLQVANVSGTYPSIATVTATVPFTWTTNDQILVSGFYERA
jgi:hypothetical protein